MVRRPKRRKPVTPPRRTQAIIFYIISILVVLSMAAALAISVGSRSAPTPTPSALLPLNMLQLL